MLSITPADESTPRSRKGIPQPLEVVALHGALLKAATVSAITGLSTSTLYRLAQRGELVPVRRGNRCTRWRSDDVRAFLSAQGDAA